MPRINVQPLRQLFQPGRRHLGATLVAALLWLIAWFDWSAWRVLPPSVNNGIFLLAAALAVFWIRRTHYQRLILTFAYFPIWQAAIILSQGGVARFVGVSGMTIAFFIGLAWAIWWVEQQSRGQLHNRYRSGFATTLSAGEKIWNPLQLDAWYYTRKHPRLEQSFGTLITYALIFFLAVYFLTQLSGCRELYEMPAGGGKPVKLQQIVRIQKVIRKKFVINPYSAVIFNPPPIDDVKLQLLEVTKHEYKVGFGEGSEAGFATGTARGKVRIIRLEYDGGDWNQDLSANADLNLLIEYGIRTGQAVNDRTESRRIAQLRNFPPRKSPPFVYITGQKEIIIPDADVDTLRDYLLEKHGMLFADNGGSGGWHEQFFNLMRRVLPNIKPVPVPLDHAIHRVPYEIPFMPYVAPHGGRDAWGWVVDSRLVAYYHPGDIGDAWADGHAGVKRDIWEHSYQLGVNVIFYAHSQYHQWLDSQTEDSP